MTCKRQSAALFMAFDLPKATGNHPLLCCGSSLPHKTAVSWIYGFGIAICSRWEGVSVVADTESLQKRPEARWHQVCQVFDREGLTGPIYGGSVGIAGPLSV